MSARRRGAALLALALPALVGCSDRSAELERHAAVLTGGSPERGRQLIQAYGCPACHTIPGVPGASSLVGPPLTGVAQRMYIAGVLENNPENMMRWIQNPPAVDPRTAMPYLGVRPEESRHIAAYLYTLRD